MFFKGHVIAAALVAATQGAAPSEDDWVWLESHRDAAFQALMPVVSVPRQLVAYRSYQDLAADVPETHFSIANAETPPFPPGGLTAVVTAPMGGSIQQQLLRLHTEDRDAPIERLLSKVAVRRITINQAGCPSIRARVNALSKVTIALPNRDLIVVHPMLHRVLVEIGAVRIDATLTDSKDRLIRWAADTLKTLRACDPGEG